ncbi:related to IPP1 - Inorganic pyrophosphatase, cytoplasmic [Cephalotrichum gorgonifer]|uniref:inorganic diphosphatase n=1 Tax=Cephalotrichum gorgonifer TaxID=2041049 RepID=A0AAE8SZX2_9PEZI|nr:related to IPP1 - Inorganic pyrophosphatase, cytoplasmic [Cephalotrichum gorgonifer]
MMSAKATLTALLLAGSALAKDQCVPKGNCSDTSVISDYSTLRLREVGARNTLDWRVWLLRDGKPISFWHDVPTYPDESNHQVVNMVVEIPRWTNGKLEIKRDEPLNPIFHDEKKDLPRFVENVWPHKSYPFLYGSVPQTWESPNFDHEFTNFPGDNDPVDIIDIGDNVGYVGQVKQVKVLGGLALNDGDETDWKVLAIDVNDPLAPLVNSVEDVEKYRPGLTKTYYDWFTYYKVARGDDVIPIVGEKWQEKAFIIDVLEDSHGFWKELVGGKVDPNEINYNQTSVDSIDSFISRCKTNAEFDIPKKNAKKPAAPVPEKYTWWYYLDADYKLIELPKSS